MKSNCTNCGGLDVLDLKKYEKKTGKRLPREKTVQCKKCGAIFEEGRTGGLWPWWPKVDGKEVKQSGKPTLF